MDLRGDSQTLVDMNSFLSSSSITERKEGHGTAKKGDALECQQRQRFAIRSRIDPGIVAVGTIPNKHLVMCPRS